MYFNFLDLLLVLFHTHAAIDSHEKLRRAKLNLCSYDSISELKKKSSQEKASVFFILRRDLIFPKVIIWWGRPHILSPWVADFCYYLLGLAMSRFYARSVTPGCRRRPWGYLVVPMGWR
ncbi:hypothetical protein ABFS82_13G002500 [Erythranthe guttata]